MRSRIIARPVPRSIHVEGSGTVASPTAAVSPISTRKLPGNTISVPWLMERVRRPINCVWALMVGVWAVKVKGIGPIWLVAKA